MTHERVTDALAHMRDAAALAQSYVEGMTQKAFALPIPVRSRL